MTDERRKIILDHILDTLSYLGEDLLEAALLDLDLTDEEIEELRLDERLEDARNTLPDNLYIMIDSCLADAVNDADYMQEAIKYILEYRFNCEAVSYQWLVTEAGMLEVTNIEWKRELLN